MSSKNRYNKHKNIKKVRESGEWKKLVAKEKGKIRMKALALATIMGISSFTQTYAVNSEAGVQEEDNCLIDVSSDVETKDLIHLETVIQEDREEFEQLVLDFADLDESNIEIEEYIEIGKITKTACEQQVDLLKGKIKIKNVYGGEISASENGVRTEDEILYAVNCMGWRKEERENIVEMMNGLMQMQRDFDLDPLCALAVFHHESMCGVAYEKYRQCRLANIQRWEGQKGVIGYSQKFSYGLYSSYSSAAYDFANYVRNSPALKGAKTMADLESFNGNTCIFDGAATDDAITYNRLKKYAEQGYTNLETDYPTEGEVTDNVLQMVEGCTVEEIEEMTEYIKAKIQEKDTQTQEERGENSER